jgi:hypothetical protein
VEIRYGVGTRLYFSFLKLIAITNAILAAIGIVSWSIFLSSTPTGPTGAPFQWGDFFTSAYGTQDRQNWWISGVLAFISWWWLGRPFIPLRLRLIGQKLNQKLTFLSRPGLLLLGTTKVATTG